MKSRSSPRRKRVRDTNSIITKNAVAKHPTREFEDTKSQQAVSGTPFRHKLDDLQFEDTESQEAESVNSLTLKCLKTLERNERMLELGKVTEEIEKLLNKFYKASRLPIPKGLKPQDFVARFERKQHLLKVMVEVRQLLQRCSEGSQLSNSEILDVQVTVERYKGNLLILESILEVEQFRDRHPKGF